MKQTPPLCDLQNMSPEEMILWADAPTTLLASTDKGRKWQDQLCSGTVKASEAQKIANTIWRHARQVQKRGFGRTEVGKSGYTKRHIALMNLGFDPSRPAPGIDLSERDRQWLCTTEGALERRR